MPSDVGVQWEKVSTLRGCIVERSSAVSFISCELTAFSYKQSATRVSTCNPNQGLLFFYFPILAGGGGTQALYKYKKIRTNTTSDIALFLESRSVLCHFADIIDSPTSHKTSAVSGL